MNLSKALLYMHDDSSNSSLWLELRSLLLVLSMCNVGLTSNGISCDMHCWVCTVGETDQLVSTLLQLAIVHTTCSRSCQNVHHLNMSNFKYGLHCSISGWEMFVVSEIWYQSIHGDVLANYCSNRINVYTNVGLNFERNIKIIVTCSQTM